VLKIVEPVAPPPKDVCIDQVQGERNTLIEERIRGNHSRFLLNTSNPELEESESTEEIFGQQALHFASILFIL
jgi:hypothetical protein